jgi:hypothetical protein
MTVPQKRKRKLLDEAETSSPKQQVLKEKDPVRNGGVFYFLLNG